MTMPLKYFFNILEPNKIIGMIHGMFFILYVLIILKIKSELNWTWRLVLFAFTLAFIPFGTFYLDKKYLSIH
jgi:integral membrane protein